MNNLIAHLLSLAFFGFGVLLIFGAGVILLSDPNVISERALLESQQNILGVLCGIAGFMIIGFVMVGQLLLGILRRLERE